MNKKFNYEKYYSDYWEGEYSKRIETRYFEKIYDRFKKKLTPKNNLKIIDVGGGNGHFSYYLNLKEPTIFDISDSGLEFARTKFNYKTIKGDVHNMHSIKEGSFDVAFCMEIAEHLDFPNLLFTNVHRVLGEGGVLFVSVPNEKIDGIQHKKRWKFKELIEDLRKSGFRLEWSNNNPRFYHKHIGKKSLGYLFANTMFYIFPEKFKFYLSRKFPDYFSAMFIVKAIKI